MSSVRLSPQQNAVVNHQDGPLLVVAGPGSGKTRVLTERIRRLLTEVPGHFRVLALTFTNKAANEMKERLKDIGPAKERAFVGTLHSFCMEVLRERGKLVGLPELPHIFEQHKDRREILLQAIAQDPLLADEVDAVGDAKSRTKLIEDWLQNISRLKAHPATYDQIDDEVMKRIVEGYDAGLRACNACDFDDLLLLTYRLFSSYPKVAEFYQRLYRFVCVDEAQDLNEAQYSLLKAFCGDKFRNLMLVGDPKQSIYGFNKSSPDFMWKFKEEFGAELVELTENFRSSRAVVDVARSLEPTYLVAAQLPIGGEVRVLVGEDEEHEAVLIADELQRVVSQGHPDIEGPVSLEQCAILGRTRFALLTIEQELKVRKIPYYKKLSANHENESDLVEDFQLGLRIAANPSDRLHWNALMKRWGTQAPHETTGKNIGSALSALQRAATSAGTARANAVYASLTKVFPTPDRVDIMAGVKELKKFADSEKEGERAAIYEDLAVFAQEWDQYLRNGGSPSSVAAFMSSKALGATQQAARDGVALLTVHSSKGLEFDVVFVAGMAEGVFPDYRAQPRSKEMAEEARNAFVAVTRSKRLLFLSYPRERRMPWGDLKTQRPSRFLVQAGIVG